MNLLNKYLRPSSNIEFRLTKSVSDTNNGFVDDEYKVFYKGIKVEGIGYMIHKKGDKIISMSGNFVDVPEMNTTSNISRQTGLQKALNLINAKKYIWGSQQYEERLKEMENDKAATYYPQGNFIITRSA